MRETCAHIVGSDSLTVYFAADTPTSMLPKVGDNLFTDDVSPELPIGFIGKVESIEHSSGH